MSAFTAASLFSRSIRFGVPAAAALALAGCDVGLQETEGSQAWGVDIDSPARFAEAGPEHFDTMPCLGDAGEPDDDAASAVLAEFDVPMARSACDTDEDHFAMSLEAHREVRVEAIFDRSEGDLELQAFGPDGGLVGTSQVLGDRAVLEFTGELAGDYDIQAVLVDDFGDTDGTTYSLRVKDPLATCSPDALEPNDGSESALLDADGLSDQTACAGDDDWFAASVENGQTLHVDMWFASQHDDIDFAVYDPSGAYRGGAFGDSSLHDTFSVEADMDGEWLVLVYLDEGSAQGVGYGLELRVE